jgi:hypothetical protein
MYVGYYPFGQLVPNRHGSSTAYRYGFQGQEKDDELKGEGNSYNFGDYGLDVRIGRRLNLDPVLKPFQSGYITFGNDPISRIDHDGNDDVFYIKKNGKVGMYRTLKGTAIKIKTKDGIINYSDLSLNSKSNRTIATKIFSNYSFEVLGKGKIGIADLKDNKEAAAYTNSKTKEVFLNTNGGINPAANDYNDLKNIIAHERYHKESKEVISTFGDHAEIYAKQFEDKTFNNTTDKFKESILASVATYMVNGIYGNKNVGSDGLENILIIMNDINKSLKKAKGGYQLEYESDGLNSKDDGFVVKKNGVIISERITQDTKKEMDVN